MYEENIIIKDWRNVDLTFGLVFPNQYELGLSSYTIRLLYFLINTVEKYVCERIFLPKNIRFPASKDISSINQLRSIENAVLPIDFDILGFSIHFENDVKNVLWILEKSDIPLKSQERNDSRIKNDSQYPLIIGGGPAITSNPLSLSKIFDLFFIGDAEPSLFHFLEKFSKFKLAGGNFTQFLKEMKEIEGIFIPSLSNKVKRAILSNLDESPNPIFQVISKSSEEKKIFQENFMIEVNRGCPFQCKFCISSFHNSPFRNRSYENILDVIEKVKKISTFVKVSLIGSCVSSHPKFYEICQYILGNGLKFTLPSIRLEHLTPKVIRILEKGDIKTVTIAPETGSESLRYALGKKISNEKIFEVLKLLKRSTIKNIKFYFLIGLPNEKDEDLDDIIRILKEIDQLGFEKGVLRININPFVPKFNTPYEGEINNYLSDNIIELRRKFQKIERELKKVVSIKLKFQNVKDILNNARLQTILSLADQKVADIFIDYYMNGANMGALRRTEKELDFSIDEYLLKIKTGYRPWQLKI